MLYSIEKKDQKDIDLAAEPEEGAHAETAAVHDAAADALKKAREAQRAAEETAEKAAENKRALHKATGLNTDENKLNRIEKEAAGADNKAEIAARTAAKASAKAASALQAAEKLNGTHRKDGW
ncbi:hypothetical protein ACFL43_01475 [Thermodesulfobacteriota bacterium]